MSNDKQVMVKMVLDMWNQRLKATDEKFSSFTDEQMQTEVAPGKNRAIYLLGHLTAVHDHMLSQLGFEPSKYPQLDEPFIKKADKEVKEIPSVAELRKQWKEVNAKLSEHFNKLTPEQWFQRHMLVSEADFAKEPHRNRLNLVNGRTMHLQSHLGQLNLIKSK